MMPPSPTAQPTRRDLAALLPALTFLLGGAPEYATARVPVPASSLHRPDGTRLLRHDQIFSVDKLPAEKTSTGSFQPVIRGALPTGEIVELHNTVLLPGQAPHPPHRHLHTEFLFLQAGHVEWLVDGVPRPAGPGDILYAASNVLHGLRNTGAETARYFVLAIGANLKA